MAPQPRPAPLPDTGGPGIIPGAARRSFHLNRAARRAAAGSSFQGSEDGQISQAWAAYCQCRCSKTVGLITVVAGPGHIRVRFQVQRSYRITVGRISSQPQTTEFIRGIMSL
jgi:hypothetical protein